MLFLFYSKKNTLQFVKIKKNTDPPSPKILSRDKEQKQKNAEEKEMVRFPQSLQADVF